MKTLIIDARADAYAIGIGNPHVPRTAAEIGRDTDRSPHNTQIGWNSSPLKPGSTTDE